MQRNYLAAGLLPAGVALAAAGLLAAVTPWSEAAALFEAQPVDPGRFAVLARPVGQDGWTLLVLEQIRPAPLCWRSRSDGLVDPSLNRFDYTGICGRFIDSNAYSLRFGSGELPAEGSAGLRLRVEPAGNELQVQASSPDLAGVLVVGRAPLPARVRDAFVAIRLEPGWELRRRSYGGQLLNHLYFSNPIGARDLLARAAADPAAGRGRRMPRLAPPPPPPPVMADVAPTPSIRPVRGRQRQRQPWTAPAPIVALPAARPSEAAAGRVIALQVIPFRE